MANKTASALGFIGVGWLLLWSGVTNAGVLSTVQSLVAGHPPVPGQPTPSIFGGKSVGSVTGSSFNLGNAGSGGNSAIASDALRYVGVPYTWGGSAPPESAGGPAGRKEGWDCYGFLTWVLHHDLGYNLPNNTHSGYLEMMAWSGAVQVSKSSIQAGDLIIWPTHCGIAVSGTEMISAENPSQGTKVNTFANGGPLAPEPMTVLRVTGGMVTA